MSYNQFSTSVIAAPMDLYSFYDRTHVSEEDRVSDNRNGYHIIHTDSVPENSIEDWMDEEEFLNSHFPGIQYSMNILQDAMRLDPAYAYGWHANLAMPILDYLDGRITHAEANEIASRLMKHIFNADTSHDMLLDKTTDSE